MKPDTRLQEGVADLLYYIGQLGYYVPGPDWRRGTAAPPPSTLYFTKIPELTIYLQLAAPGVITYELGPNWNRMAADAAVGFVIGFVTTLAVLMAHRTPGSGAEIIRLYERIGMKEAA